MKNIQNLMIDINKKPFQTVTANTGEVASRFVKITILDNNIPIDLTGVTASLYAEKPDGKKVFNNVTIEDKKNGIILTELTSQILAVEGLVKLTLLLVKNGAKLCSKQFLLNVDSSIVDDEAIESTNEFGALTESLSKVNEWGNYFEETSGKIEEKYTERLNNVGSQLEHIENKTHHYISACNFEQTDSEVDFYELIQEAKEKNIREIVLESKTYIFNNPIKITDIMGLKIKGSGHMVGTTFRFNNNTVDETFITLGVVGGQVYSSFSSFENINFLDNNSNSTCFKIIGSQINGAQANWKNYFSNCQIRNFKTGVIFDTVTPNIPHTHGYGAESMFFNCKFKNNKTSIITRNYQSVNTHFIGTDIENDQANEEFTFIEAQCGIGIDFTGGSFIGKGKLLVLKGEIPNTHPSSTFIFKDLRFELWDGHNGVLIEEDKSFSIYSETFIIFDKCSFVCFNQAIDFIRYSSRITLNIDKCKVLSGSLIIKHYPTIGRSGVINGDGEYGEIKINDSCGFYFDKQKTSPYGTYDAKYRNRCLIQNSFANGNGAISTNNGFKKLKSYDTEQIAMELSMVNFKHIVYNNEQPTAGFKNVKFSLPKYGRPCKFFVYKQPLRYSDPIKCKLYLVKDKEYWVNQNEFSVDTDGILVSTIDTSNGAGYYESEIRLNSNSIGYILQAGDGEGSQTWTWNEGNLYIKNENSWGNSFAGFVGVTYI